MKAFTETVSEDYLRGGWLLSLREVPRDATSAALTKSRPSNDREVYP
jgi:nitrogen fixation protein